jgi:hypothetical protein
MKIKTRKVTNCKKCPFMNYDKGGDNGCNLNYGIDFEPLDYQAPEDRVDQKCPLKHNAVLVRL